MSASAAVSVAAVTKAFTSMAEPVVAVRDVSVELDEGSATAFIGPNGAGKSTLLKLIAGILVPTQGSIRRRRRCASLIELGAGFHPDLTGRENLDLVFALAGLGRREQRRRRPDAIEFAGIGDAVDRPVRHLSSGMMGRLACAAAMHTSPDVLLIDEVLAVGDGAFQREMLLGVAALQREGTTLALVTHSPELAAIATSRTVWLHEGGVVQDGPTPEVLTRYEATVRGWGRSFEPPSTTIERLELDPPRIEPSDPLRIRAELRCRASSGPLAIRVEARPVAGDGAGWMRALDESADARHLNLLAATDAVALGPLTPGQHRVEIVLPTLPITSTELELSLLLTDGAGLIIDEVSCSLAIGTAPRRPIFDVVATVIAR